MKEIGSNLSFCKLDWAFLDRNGKGEGTNVDKNTDPFLEMR